MRFQLVLAQDFNAGGGSNTVRAGTTIGELAFAADTPVNMQSPRFIADAIRGGSLVHAREIEEDEVLIAESESVTVAIPDIEDE